jgi:malonate-semialdehyde dehydrogenase (acetylating)/methylmalonate-semialdehyde dehydrogenase
MPDADLDQAAKALTGAAFGSAGERCMAISVVVAVGKKTADQLIDKLTPLIHNIKINAGDVPDCDMGPLISSAHRSRVIEAIDKGVKEGAKLVVDGRSFQHPDLPNGFFVGPTLFDEVTENMSVYQQEIFGPVLCMVRVDHFEEAIALINHHQYGNGTAIFTRDGYTAREYCARIQVGMVGVNIPIPVPIANHPFGGWKNSCFGDTNMHGKESFHFYTRRETVTSKWLDQPVDDKLFSMPTHRQD